MLSFGCTQEVLCQKNLSAKQISSSYFVNLPSLLLSGLRLLFPLFINVKTELPFTNHALCTERFSRKKQNTQLTFQPIFKNNIIIQG